MVDFLPGREKRSQLRREMSRAKQGLFFKQTVKAAAYSGIGSHYLLLPSASSICIYGGCCALVVPMQTQAGSIIELELSGALTGKVTAASASPFSSYVGRRVRIQC
jgi:hypothetical protein